MNSMSTKAEFVSYANELTGAVKDWRSTMIMSVDTFEVFCADPATKYLVTFEMTIKPLPEGPSTSGSHPLTDGSER